MPLHVLKTHFLFAKSINCIPSANRTLQMLLHVKGSFHVKWTLGSPLHAFLSQNQTLGMHLHVCNVPFSVLALMAPSWSIFRSR